MKHVPLQKLTILLRICIGIFVACLACLLLFSFTPTRFTDDLFKQLGITRADADKKITTSMLGGFPDHYGIKNTRSIAIANRAAMAKDLLAYTKQQTINAAFIKAYMDMREREKPEKTVVQTPQEMRAAEIAIYTKSVEDSEALLKKADASMKAIFEQALAESKKGLANAESGSSHSQAAYESNYPALLKMTEESNQQRLSEWEHKYPANHSQFIKRRLQQFLNETADIDFEASLEEKNGKFYFANRAYEAKNKNWKMAFRAGKIVIEPARQFVQQWLAEL